MTDLCRDRLHSYQDGVCVRCRKVAWPQREGGYTSAWRVGEPLSDDEIRGLGYEIQPNGSWKIVRPDEAPVSDLDKVREAARRRLLRPITMTRRQSWLRPGSRLPLRTASDRIRFLSRV
jgi:hypothetical protein